MRKELKKRQVKKCKLVYSKETEKPLTEEPIRYPASISFVPPVVGMIASEVVMDLTESIMNRMRYSTIEYKND